MSNKHKQYNDKHLPRDLMPTTVGSLMHGERQNYNCDWRKVGGYILLTGVGMAPHLFNPENFASAMELKVKRAGEGIDMEAFFAVCPDLAHSPEGKKIVMAYLEDSSSE